MKNIDQNCENNALYDDMTTENWDLFEFHKIHSLSIHYHIQILYFHYAITLHI